MDNSVIKIVKKNNSSIIIDVNQANHGVSVAQVLYYRKPASGVRGAYALANASQLSSANAIGLVYEVVDVNNFRMITNGFLQNAAYKNYRVGDPIYLGTIDGTTTDKESIYNKPIGVKTRNGLYVNIQRGWVNLGFEDGDDNNGFIKSNSSAASELSITQVGHGLSIGDAIYSTPSGYKKALSNETKTVEVVGVVSKVMDVNNFRVTTAGFFKTTLYDTYPNGTVLYLSEETAGLLTNEYTYIVKPIAIKIDNGVVIDIQRGSAYYPDNGSGSSEGVYKVDDKIGDIKYSADTLEVRPDGYVLFKNGQTHNKSQVQELLDAVSEDFKTLYIDITDTTVMFKNVEYLTESINDPYNNKVGNLYIKAFSSNSGSLAEIPIGNVVSKLDALPPPYYMHMDGRILVIVDYPVLASYIYSTYGSYTKYGGDGITTFGIPNITMFLTDSNNNQIRLYHYIKYC